MYYHPGLRFVFFKFLYCEVLLLHLCLYALFFEASHFAWPPIKEWGVMFQFFVLFCGTRAHHFDDEVPTKISCSCVREIYLFYPIYYLLNHFFLSVS
jgi:hypothetical protein